METGGDDMYPDWSKPATRGDVISALVLTRSCIVNTYVALSRLRRNDLDGFSKSIGDLSEADDKLAALILKISGQDSVDAG